MTDKPDIEIDIDEGVVEGSACGDIRLMSPRPPNDPEIFSIDDLIDALRQIPADSRKRPAILSVGNDARIVVGVSPDGVLHTEQVPF